MKRFSAYLIVMFTAMVLAACNASTNNDGDSYVPDKKQQSLEEQASAITSAAECTANNGNWQQVGLLGLFACVLPAADAGQACTDSSQCEVNCLVQGDVTPGTPVTGQCQATSNGFGCRALVTNGIAGAVLCID